MPAALADMSANSGNLEDQRAFQIALDLSHLSIIGNNGNGVNTSDGESVYSSSYDDKPSANMTECVPVPSSEHVAEIVGRQGCKIKALRAKTNTYIKTPVRGEEPVFVVTGRKEDVQLAKREILSAAEHFSQIRATRRNNLTNGSGTSTSTGTTTFPPSPTTPGQVTIQVRVPYRVVGLVVGPKGATIKRIQQNTHTYIVTPSRDKEPVFEVTGLPENVEKAREEIESHIALRTGGMVEGQNDDDFHCNGVDSGFHELTNDLGIFKSKSAFTAYNNGSVNSNNFYQDMNIFNFPPPVLTKISDYSLTNGLNNMGTYEDEGIGGSPSFDPPQKLPVSNIWSEFGESSLFPPTTTTAGGIRRSSLNNSATPCLSPSIESNEHSSVRRIRSDPLSTNGLSAFTPFQSNGFPTSTTNSSLSSSTSTSPTAEAARKRGCFVCSDNNITAALVPCGHNLFCMECANLICEKPVGERHCPVCSQQCSQAIRIFS